MQIFRSNWYTRIIILKGRRENLCKEDNILCRHRRRQVTAHSFYFNESCHVQC